MLLWREPVPEGWLEKTLARLPAVLVDHAHLDDSPQAEERLDFYLDLDARLITEPHDFPILH